MCAEQNSASVLGPKHQPHHKHTLYKALLKISFTDKNFPLNILQTKRKKGDILYEPRYVSAHLLKCSLCTITCIIEGACGNVNYMACSKLGKEQDWTSVLGLNFQQLRDMNSVWEHSSYSRILKEVSVICQILFLHRTA